MGLLSRLFIFSPYGKQQKVHKCINQIISELVALKLMS